MRVEPDILDFNQINVSDFQTKQLTITSTGDDTLYLEDIFIEGPAQFSLDDADMERILEPGNQTTIRVIYTPTANGDDSAYAHVVASQPAIPEAVVELRGIGLAPVISVEPAIWDFGDVGIGATEEQEIAIRNVGSAPLTLYEVVFSPTSDELVFSYYFNDGIVLAPGATDHINIYYEPRDELPDTGYLHVYSNDPVTPDALATQYGDGYLCGEVEDTFVQGGGQDTFALSSVPVEETLALHLDGVPVYVGWYFDGILNAVVFEPDYTPGYGDVITITYNLLCCC